MLFGCSSDSGSSAKLDSDFDIKIALESENTQVSQLVQNSEGLDNSMGRMLPLIEASGWELADIQEIDPMLLHIYFSSSSFNELNT